MDKKQGSGQRIFRSFFQGGFECATHRRHHIGQLDLLGATGHDRLAETDYALLATAGVHTVRDGLRWHLIERSPGVYDWSSFLPMLHAAAASGTEVIWDLCHWGVPEGLDLFSPAFVPRFEEFCTAAARVVRDATDTVPFYCPVNEISFWSWIGGDRGVFFPYGQGRGSKLKRQLAAASIAAVRAVREVDRRARFLHCEPIIHIARNPSRSDDPMIAATHTAGQFEAWDMIAGRMAPELGGGEECLDILGCNYYWNNQWQNHGELMPLGHAGHRPLHAMLLAIHERYRRPLVLSETGAEGEAAAGWLGMICAEAREALRQGADLQGLCLYPVMDYPGWDDRRHCVCGLIAVDAEWKTRSLRQNLVLELQMQSQSFAPPSA